MHVIILNVDDILVSGSNESELRESKEELKLRLQMKHLGQAYEFVGIQIYLKQSNHKLHTSQRFCAQKIFDRLKF